MLQFTKVINCFYFGNMILQTFPQIATNKPEFVAIVLATLVLIGMGKELMSDLKRHKTDRASNALPTNLVTGKLETEKTNPAKGEENQSTRAV